MPSPPSWQTSTALAVAGLGYDLVEIERAGAGLLRITIDRLPGDPSGGAITVDDCEKVTRQLQHVFEVDNVDYARLEVSSPGLDRPLKKREDYARFVGAEIDVNLRAPLAGQRKFRGVLQANGDAWRLVFHDGKADQALDFSLDEVREARLVPVLDFKGRKNQEETGGPKR